MLSPLRNAMAHMEVDRQPLLLLPPRTARSLVAATHKSFLVRTLRWRRDGRSPRLLPRRRWPRFVCISPMLPPPALFQDERYLDLPLPAQPLLRAAAKLLQAPAVHLLHLEHLEEVQERSGEKQQASEQAEPSPALSLNPEQSIITVSVTSPMQSRIGHRFFKSKLKYLNGFTSRVKLWEEWL